MAASVEHRWTHPGTGRTYERWDDGVWRYAGGTVEAPHPGGGATVPGAVDRTLTEVYKPRILMGEDGVPTAVYLSVEVIARAGDDLAWVEAVGDWVGGQGGARKAIMIDWESWKDHDVDITAMSAPELDRKAAQHRLAEAERLSRLTQLAAEAAAGARNEALRAAIKAGLPRQAAATLLGVSPGRIGQLLSGSGGGTSSP